MAFACIEHCTCTKISSKEKVRGKNNLDFVLKIKIHSSQVAKAADYQMIKRSQPDYEFLFIILIIRSWSWLWVPDYEILPAAVVEVISPVAVKHPVAELANVFVKPWNSLKLQTICKRSFPYLPPAYQIISSTGGSTSAPYMYVGVGLGSKSFWK